MHLGGLSYIGNPDPAQPGSAILQFNLTGLPDTFDVAPIISRPGGLSSPSMNLKWKMLGFSSANEICRVNDGGLKDTQTRNNQQDGTTSSIKGACKRMGSLPLSDFGFNTSLIISTCEEFHGGTVSVKVPRDTNVLKWGAISTLSERQAHYTFVDRYGAKIEFPARFLQPWLIASMVPSWRGNYVHWNHNVSQIVFSIRLSRGQVSAVIPALLIQRRALLTVFHKTSFIGQATRLSINGTQGMTYPIRWDVGTESTTLSAPMLHGPVPKLSGRFSNLLESSLDSSMRCQPALCSDNYTCSLFTNMSNPSDEITFDWIPSLSQPLDSQIAVIFPSGILYSSSVQPVHQFLSSNINLKKFFTFYINEGSPEGTMLYYRGQFKKNIKHPKHCT